MKHAGFVLKNIPAKLALLASTGFLMASLAHAEGPMNVTTPVRWTRAA